MGGCCLLTLMLVREKDTQAAAAAAAASVRVTFGTWLLLPFIITQTAARQPY